jgi:hypothetical protein
MLVIIILIRPIIISYAFRKFDKMETGLIFAVKTRNLVVIMSDLARPTCLFLSSFYTFPGLVLFQETKMFKRNN